ncbi:hypothetical protein FOI68_09605 [Brevibacillus sp. LEMMJ03]|uniref:hypothetical protein n=1 Tax=Brevibacillus sp. LEMMJ03 TaxID=2595056 RepID=UPI0005D0FF96|nr:hypothetical protein [Brevibacillus sp. LEMMJ03]TRY25982.1 hypothetical protein FOI68_09605 [Brevibacillus sp. LEMMJ03]
MEKKRYYVSVQAGTILENQGDASYELEIEASEVEVEELRSLFDQRWTNDFDSYLRAHIVAIPYHEDKENDLHDEHLRDIYATLYRLGTEETRRHIQSMGLV